jgi:acetoin utilization deacetylase AcuC-like enzyme
VLDFDVHHGNGTQAAFYGDGDLYYASTHQMPLYPGTGAADERGCGNIFNYPLAAGAGGAEFLSGWRDVLLPAMLAAQPELIIISAGFDAHRADPLATLNVNTADFATLTDDIIRLAEETSEGRILSLLEGGYDLTALADSCAVHLDRLSA